MKPYQLSVTEISKKFFTDLYTGLSKKQVSTRLEDYGHNVLPEVKRSSWLSIFISQFQSPLIYILLIAATIIFFVGEDKIDAFIISGVLFFNAIIGTIQEGRAENILESLKRFIKSNSIVLREKTKVLVEDIDLVVGDVIVLQEGQRVPADARIVESNNLQIDEAVLTGEARAIRKNTDVIVGEVPLGDQINMLFRGTYIIAGSGKAVVVATGANTEIGKIHTISEEIKTDIPLKKEIERLSYFILVFILASCIGLFVIGLLTGKSLQELLIMLTALFVCVIPEGLPVVVTLVLVSGAYRMARKNVLVKNLQGVETLGRTDVIVIDKTGTLTRNEMIVSNIFVDNERWHISGEGYHADGDIYLGKERVEKIDHQALVKKIGIAASLLNSSEITFLPKFGTFDIKGDPTEAALYVLSQKLGLSRDLLTKEYKKIYEIPFDPMIKYHAGFFEYHGKGVIFVIGSPESVVSKCSGENESVSSELLQLLEDGLRVVAVAVKYVSLDLFAYENIKQEDLRHLFEELVASDLQFLGLCGIQDSIRPEVRAVIEQVHNAGFHLIMATGDHKKTALFVASKVGIYKKGDDVIDGFEFDQLTDSELMERLDTTTVYSRVSPQQKMRIISLFHARNEIVVMTGDGINDAPSLIAADLGIAMGGIGTEVAKQAADLILLDDSFVNIVGAIEEGRHIFYTLRRVILYFFATNLGEILIVLFALLSRLPLPITAAQILWLNLVTDGFLDAALSAEPHEKNLLARNFLRGRVQLIDYDLLFKTLFMAVPMGIGSLWVFWIYYEQDIVYARTMTLITMAMYQWFNAWNCRSERLSIFQLGLLTNRWLIVATTFVLSLQFFILHTGFMQSIFDTVPIAVSDWVIIIVVSLPILFFEELRKLAVRSWYSID